jgi:phosphopentomutase/deoxyribose-phosphate aldolase
MQVNRVIVIVLDSVGIGEAPDAAAYNDVGSHTLGNMAAAVGGLHVPNMEAMGLGNIAILEGVEPQVEPTAVYGKMAEVSAGKDTTTGHWELMGLHLHQPFPLYPDGFPPEIMEPFEEQIGRGTLGNYPASGTVIIEELGEEHMRTGKPIVYTSGDSVFQIAAHEDVIPIEELYEICHTARDLLHGPHEVSRVIARPFVGEPGNFTRTANRHDYSINPPEPTLLDNLKEAGLMVHAVGKINDIFVGQGITSYVFTKDNMDGVDKTIAAIKDRREPGLIFTNLVDFDAKFGHRNNPQGYADALAEFDKRLPEIVDALAEEDLLVLTADHGNDPVTPSTDHSREYVPLLITGNGARQGVNFGVRDSFADLAATIADILQVAPPPQGFSFKDEILVTPGNANQDELREMLAEDPTLIARLIDHTLLRADAEVEEIERLCDEALRFNFASVCVNPTHVGLVADRLDGSPVLTCTVVGFPLGATTSLQKAIETELAVYDGAQEIDMVINIGALKDGNLEFVENDIAAVVEAAHEGGALCKVIIETALLTDSEKIHACELAKNARADFVKTSTGFSTGGATVEDVALMRETVGSDLGVKASGGVRTGADALAMVEAGANRIGASSGVSIMKEILEKEN